MRQAMTPKLCYIPETGCKDAGFLKIHCQSIDLSKGSAQKKHMTGREKMMENEIKTIVVGLGEMGKKLCQILKKKKGIRIVAAVFGG